MDLSLLSNDELVSQLGKIVGNERQVTLNLMSHLMELERRALHLELGYSSLFEYCVRKLGFSEASAFRRITGARCIRDFPELKDLFLSGKVTLCSIAAAAKSLKKEQTSVAEIVGKSKREIQELVSKHEPVTKIKEVVKPVVLAMPKVPLFDTPPTEERYSLKFSVSKAAYKKLEEARNRLSNALGNNLSVEAVIEKLLDNYLKPQLRKQRTYNPEDRYVPRATKHAVCERDKGQCTFVSADGTRCAATRHLQIDHIVPFAVGGKTELGNLRLLCSAHNRHEAKRYFGESYTSQFVSRKSCGEKLPRDTYFHR